MMIQSARIIFLHTESESLNTGTVNKSRYTYELINKLQGNNGSFTVPTEAEIVGLKSGTIQLYIYGLIRYRDEYSWLLGARETGFCYLYDPNASVGEFKWNTCKEKQYTYAR
jgi:hypothetical protein